MVRATAAATEDGGGAEATFRDGLGVRQLAADPDTGEAVEAFAVAADLAAQDRALRERFERLLNFRNVRFPRLLHFNAETTGPQKHVSIVSEHVPGVRLSELLAFVGAHPTLVMDVNAALQIAREVLPALAVLHDSRGVTHGAVSLERLVLTAQPRIAIVDYALGAALTKLSFPRTRLWRDYRIAMPPSAGVPRFDCRADVAGLALGVFALMLGRPIAQAEFPDGLRRLLDAAVERLPNGTVRPLSSSLRGWFDRALPTDTRRPFGTAAEAQLALEEVLKKERAYAPAAGALKSFLQRYASARPGDAPGARQPVRRPQVVALPESVPQERGVPAARGGAGARRLSAEEEEADEIRALEVELARLAREEAAGQPVGGTAREPLQAADDIGLPGQAAPAGPAIPDDLPMAATVPPVEPLAFVEVESESVEIAILVPGSELPEIDVAALSDVATSVVVGGRGEALVAPLLPSVLPVADLEIRDDELLLQDIWLTASTAMEPEIDPEIEAAIEPALVPLEPEILDEEPAWSLTPPETDDAPLASGIDAIDFERARCDRTASIDFDVPPVYVQDLVTRGAVGPDLEARPGAVAAADLLRVQMFAACVSREPREAVMPVRRSRRRGVGDETTHVRLLPDRSTAVASTGLSVHRPGRLAALREASAGENAPVATLTLVPAEVHPGVRRPPLAALPAMATSMETALEAGSPIVPDEVSAPFPDVPLPLMLAVDAVEDLFPTEPVIDAEVLPAFEIAEVVPELPADETAIAALADELARGVVAEELARGVAAEELARRVAAEELARRVAAEEVVERPAAPRRVRGKRARGRTRRTEPRPVPARLAEPRLTAEPGLAEPPAIASPAVLPTPVEPPVADPQAVEPCSVEPPVADPRAVVAPRSPEPPPLRYEPWRIPATAASPDHAAQVESIGAHGPRHVLPDPWSAGADAARESQVVPFVPRSVETAAEAPRTPAATPHDPAGAALLIADRPALGEGPSRALLDWQSPASDDLRDPGYLPDRGGRRRWRIDWKRTAAASLAVMLLEGVAFATAYWLVNPTEMGSLLVDTTQAGIEVLIDGRRSGLTPLSVQLKPGRYTLEMRGFGATKVLPVEISPGVQTTQSLKWPRGARVGTLNVKTTPPGARIIMDGTYRGTSPLLLGDVPAGEHIVVAESAEGIVTSRVEVSDKVPADVDIAIFSGFLTVYAPVEVRVFEGSKLLGTSLDGKMLIAPGPHAIDLVNKSLGYRERREVEIEPGKESVLSIEVPDGSIVIEAPDGTEIIVDGQPAGMMPIDKVTAPIGTREVVLKHPAIGERRLTVTVGADIPARVSLLAPQ